MRCSTQVNAAAEPPEAEEGLVGFTLNPDFSENHWAYILYAMRPESAGRG